MALEAIAREHDSSMSWVVRRAVNEFLEKSLELKREELVIKAPEQP